MELEVDKNQKNRLPEDYIHFKLALPSTYVYEEPSEDDVYVERDKHYTVYAMGGYKDQSFGEILTEKFLSSAGIEDGGYNILHKPDVQWGHKAVVINHIPLGMAAELYKNKLGQCEWELKPKVPIWYQCIRLTEEERQAMVQIVEGVAERRVTKKRKVG